MSEQNTGLLIHMLHWHWTCFDWTQLIRILKRRYRMDKAVENGDEDYEYLSAA